MYQCNNCYILIFLLHFALVRSTRNVTKIIVTLCVDMVHGDAKCNNVRKQNQFASGPLLIMRLNDYSKAFGCVVVCMLNVQVNSFSVMSGRRHRLRFFLEDGGCGASARSRIIKLEKHCVGINMI